MRVGAGEQGAFASNWPVNTGTSDITLDRITLTTSQEDIGARVTQVWLVDTTDGSPLVAGVGLWPSDFKLDPSDLLPVRGYRLPPGGEVVLVLVLDVSRTGRWLCDESVVDYSYRGHRYRESVDDALLICPPSDLLASQDPCYDH